MQICIEAFLQDVRYALRSLRRSPGFTIIALLTLTLGIGATTAIFSVIDAVLLNPLPYEDSNRLAILWKSVLKKDIQTDWTSYPTLKDWRDQNSVFEDIALVFRPEAARVTVTSVVPPERIQAAKVSSNLFSLLGVIPVLGRMFSPQEGERGDPVVVLSQAFWRVWFGASADVIGKNLEIDGRSFSVIGVMPASFQFPSKDAQLWMLNTADSRWPQFKTIRLADAFFGVGRLKRGVTFPEAQAAMSVIAHRLEQDHPDTDAGLGVNVVPLELHIAGNRLRLQLWVLFGAVVFVLLIACANVANLVLARGATRAREMAVRTALGAGRWRLARQLIAENALLSLVAGVFGIVLAASGVRILIALAPSDVPRLEETRMNLEILLFALGVSLSAGFVLGVLPAWRFSRSDPNASLKESGRAASGGLTGIRTRRVLVIAEFALAGVLLTGTGLLVRSLLRLEQVDPGFKPERLLALEIELPDWGQERQSRTSAFSEQVIQRIAALPGIEGVAVGSALSGEHIPNVVVTIEGRPIVLPAEQREAITDQIISDSYFRVMGIPLLKGRLFSRLDNPTSPLVAVINQTMARRLWPGGNPVGQRFKYGVPGWNSEWHIVVGIAGDVLPNGAESHASSLFYLSHRQESRSFVNLVVRTVSDPLPLAEAIRQEVHSIDKGMPRFEVATIEQQLQQLGSRRKLQTWLLSLFSLLALVLAAIGIYGIMHYSVTQRTHEIGIRMALGAPPSNVLGMVIRQALALALIGVAMGVTGGLWMTRALASLLYGVTPTDPATFALVSIILAVVALFASFTPAWRAAKVDPLVALRHE
jgi:putative ABC transport system permease protein